jgi:hypothetical protein
MVGDVHRTLLYGGIFGYPADKKNQAPPHTTTHTQNTHTPPFFADKKNHLLMP